MNSDAITPLTNVGATAADAARGTDSHPVRLTPDGGSHSAPPPPPSAHSTTNGKPGGAPDRPR